MSRLSENDMRELERDRARLDWLYSTHGHTLNQHGEANLVRFEWKFADPDFRAAIDAAIVQSRATGRDE